MQTEGDTIETELSALESNAEETVIVEPDASEAEQVETEPTDQQADGTATELPLEEIKQRWEDQQKATAAERAQRRELARQLEESKRQTQIMQQRMQQLAQAGQQPDLPDPQEDIIGYMEALKTRLDQRDQQDAQIRQQQEQLRAQNQFVEQLRSTVDDYETEFRETHADYDKATDYLLDIEQQRLEAMGYDAATASKLVDNWAINSANIMIKNGRNPAQAAYEQALKMGYKPANTAGQDKIDQVRNGQAAAKTMSGGGVAANSATKTLKHLAQLEGEEFDKGFEEFWRG